MRGLFVTATDTAVGKTVVATGLARGLRQRGIDAGVWKPVQSGHLHGDPTSDSSILRAGSGVADPEIRICPWTFPAELTPMLAARQVGVDLSIEDVVDAGESLAARHELMIVEGAGGLHVPAGSSWTILNLAEYLGLPCVVVARPGLGTINHSLLTIGALRARGLPVAGIILNGYEGAPPPLRPFDELPPDQAGDSIYSNAWMISTWGRVPILGMVPMLELEDPAERALAVTRRLNWPAIAAVLDLELADG